MSEQNKKIIRGLHRKDLTNIKYASALLDMAISEKVDDLPYALEQAKEVQKIAAKESRKKNSIEFANLYWKATLMLAPYFFEDFLYYMEKDRAPQKRFYMPRRRTLKVVVDDLQDLEDGKLEFYGLSMPPRTGKSTICIFFMAWIMGKRPNSHNAMSGHSGILADGFYSEALNLMELDVPEDKRQYHFTDIFPQTFLMKKSAEKKEVTLNDPDRFATLTCRGIDGTWTGAVDISWDGYLYVDDMVRDRQESLSPSRLGGRYQDYLNLLVDRKNDGTRELMVGTRWNVMDPLGRVEKQYKDNPRYRFRKIPALNEEGKSNFIYDYGKGFSTEYFENLKKRLDLNEWMAKYQQKPFIREGLLFPEDELRTWNGVLPPEETRIQICTACDVAWGSGDSLSMPIGYQYQDGTVYIVDWVFSNASRDYTIPKVIGKIKEHGIQKINFEADNGGSEYKNYVDEKLIEDGYKCSCTATKAPNTMAKLAKIQQYAPDIKRNFVFLDAKHRSKEYEKAYDEFTNFVQIGKNEHDDAADSLAQMEAFLDGGRVAKAEYVDSPY